MVRQRQAEALSPCLGARVTGLDLAEDMRAPTMQALAALLFDRGVVVIPGQRLSPAQYVHFARHFGRPLAFFIPEHRDPDHPEIIHISNDPAIPASQRDGAVHWHSDSSYEAEPGAVTMLLGVEAPDAGGETHFASTSAAYADLPAEMRARLDGLVARHELGRAPWIEGESQPDPDRPRRATDAPEHPLVMVHPVTGRKGLF
ncbi:MAG TPA: TauD/TfdA family dioxygenase, partial [Novosphingobium sp.]|nr:TauD/TfdA family dioxygenase [Novosphingobium sp.]